MRGMRAVCLLLPLCLVAPACAGDDDGDPGDEGDSSSGDDSSADDGGDDGDGGGGGGEGALEHAFPSVPLESGDEVTNLCLSWSVGNQEPIYVQSVTMNAGPGWHHSNWFYVPSGTFPVEDGVWECQDDFDQFTAALAGGVLFAQSTQATDETQAFPVGAVLELPPNAVVVSNIHLLNASEEAIDTGVSMTLATVKEEDVSIRLRPLSFTFDQLAIPPQQSSRFEAECDMEEQGGSLEGLSLYYALPHYHSFAKGMNIEMLGGERDGETIHQVESGIGEPLGVTLSPPLSMTGARGIRFSCDYENTTERTIGYGNSGEDEMCIFLAFTDSDRSWAGGVLQGDPKLSGMDGDVAVYTGDCGVLSVTPNQ
jgi:hypothetical protein